MPRDDVSRVILAHHARYPDMQIEDMVKLLYQQEFGPGHFVKSADESLSRLQTEAAQIDCDHEQALFEDIGNGLARLHLSGLGDELSLTTVNRFFVHTAQSRAGSNEGFCRRLDTMLDSCRSGSLPWPVHTVKAFLSDYRQAGYPPMSHSSAYREAYRPAYRLVLSQFAHYFALFARLDAMLSSGSSVLVAIDGPAASGKSSLAALVAAVYACNVFHMDDYFLPEMQKTAARLLEAGGNVDYERFKAEVMAGIASGSGFTYRPFCCQSQTLRLPIHISPHQLNVVEGAYSLHPTLTGSYDLKVFLTIDAGLQNQRILERNGPALHRRFLTEWIPLENRYFTELDIADHCDLSFAPFGE